MLTGYTVLTLVPGRHFSIVSTQLLQLYATLVVSERTSVAQAAGVVGLHCQLGCNFLTWRGFTGSSVRGAPGCGPVNTVQCAQ